MNAGTPKKRKKPVWENAFLKALCLCGNVQRSARYVKIGRMTAYNHRNRCPEFSSRWDLALRFAATNLEDEALRRAKDGLRRLKFGKDGLPLNDPETNKPYTEYEYSDTLLMFLLKGLLPEKYNINAKEIKQLQQEVEEIKKLIHVNPDHTETGTADDPVESPGEDDEPL